MFSMAKLANSKRTKLVPLSTIFLGQTLLNRLGVVEN
jgi:hypothetical protein